MSRIIHVLLGNPGNGHRFHRDAGRRTISWRGGLGLGAAVTLAGVIVGLPVLAQTSPMGGMMGGSMMSMTPGMGAGGGQGCVAMMQSMGSRGWNGRPNDQWRDRNGEQAAPAPGGSAT